MPDLKQALRDFVATSNSGKYSDEETLMSKFPELKGYDIQALRDFVATSNSGKYATEDELFSKFPEFNQGVPVKKKFALESSSEVGSSEQPKSTKSSKNGDKMEVFKGLSKEDIAKINKSPEEKTNAKFASEFKTKLKEGKQKGAILKSANKNALRTKSLFQEAYKQEPSPESTSPFLTPQPQIGLDGKEIVQQKSTLETIGMPSKEKIEQDYKNLDLDNPTPFISASTYGRQPIDGINIDKDNFINDTFTDEKLINLGIDPADFDGYLNISGFKDDYNKRKERGDFESGSVKNPKLNEEIYKSRLLSNYIKTRNDREVLKSKLQSVKGSYEGKKIPVNKNAKAFDNNLVSIYTEENLPVLSQKLKERDELNKEKYKELTEDNTGLNSFAIGTKNFLKSAFNGFIDSVNKTSSTVYDALGADDLAEDLRYLNEERQLERPSERQVSFASGKVVDFKGKKYLVDEKGTVYDKDNELVVNDLIEEDSLNKILKDSKTSKEEDWFFSPQGTAVQTGSVLGDMVWQVAYQATVGRVTKGSGLLTKSLSKLSIPKTTADAIIAQASLGYSQAYQTTLKEAREAGLTDKEAEQIAGDAAQRTAIWYGMTAPISPQTKAVESLFGSAEKELIKKAVTSYKTNGKQGFISTLNNGFKQIPKKAVGFAEEGGKEVIQEDIQQSGESLWINAQKNIEAGREISDETMSFDDFMNTSILSFLSGGTAANLSLPSISVNKKTQVKNLFELSQNMDVLDANLSEMVNNKVISKEDADNVKKDAIAVSRNITRIPKDTNPEIQLDVMRKLSEVEDLENSKKTLDKSFHSQIDNQIEEKRNEVEEIYNSSLTKQNKTDAVQEQSTTEVPVQSETITSETMETGVPESGPEVVTEQVTQEEIAEPLKDIESTAKALNEDLVNSIEESTNILFPKNENTNLIVSERYHKAKQDGTNPELVQAVETLLAPEPIEQVAKEEVIEPLKITREKVREVSDEDISSLYDEIPLNFMPINENTTPQDAVFEAYYKSKQSNKNPELVSAVENLLTPKVSEEVIVEPTETQVEVTQPQTIIEEQVTEPQVVSEVNDLLELDTKDQTSLKRVLDYLDSLDSSLDLDPNELNDVTRVMAINTAKAVVKTLKALVKAGITLQEAIKTASEIHSVADKDVLKAFDVIKQGGRQKSAPSASTSDIYAGDGRIISIVKDVKKITMSEKDLLVKQIKDKAKGVKDVVKVQKEIAKELADEIKELSTKGTISATQAANIVSKFSKVNLLNEASVSNFVDYMSKVFADAEYDNKINVAKSKIKNAKKNIVTKLGMADGLIIPLQRLFSINPNLIPEQYLDKYLELVNVFSDRAQVLSLEKKSKVTKDVEDILDEINNEQSLSDELADRFESSDNKVFKDGVLDYSASVKNMLKEGEIDADEAGLMYKYKNKITESVEKSKMTDEEIQEEKDVLVSLIKKSNIDSSGLSTRDEINLAKKLGRLIKEDAVKELSNAELKNILKLIDNINNNYIPHYAQLMVEKLTSIKNAKPLESAVKKSNFPTVSYMYSKIKSLFTKKDSVFEMIRRNPLFYIDQVLGNFKTKDVFNSVLEMAAEGESKFNSEFKSIKEKLTNAQNNVAKSLSYNPNKVLESSFKMMTYSLQLEYESNLGNKQVNPASDFIKATIKHINDGKSQFGERDADILKKILNDFSDSEGNIDNKKLYNSFNKEEKNAIKTVREVNESLTEKSEYTASIIRGQKLNPLNNYIHLNVLHEHQPNDLASGTSFADNYNNSLRPSTKAKSLIERTGKVSPLNFDIFTSAERGSKFVLMDYHLTEPIRVARRTINRTISNLEKEGNMSKKDRKVINAINNAFEESIDNLISNTYVDSSIADDVVDEISRQGYRGVLAGTGRFGAELLSNVGFILLSDPTTFTEGLKNRGIIMSPDAPKIMNNVNSKETNRIFPSDMLSGRLVDTSILSQSIGTKGAASKNAFVNKVQQIWNLTGKKYKNAVELTADALISTPDKAVMRPIWFGSFATNFEKLTGEKVDFKKIADNDSDYMEEYRDAIDESKIVADERSVITGASSNAFTGLLKGTSKPNQSATIKAFNNFNNFMSRFLIYEYVTARTGIYAAMGNGSLTRRQGVALLAAVTTRMTVYSLLMKAFGSGLIGLLFDDDDEEKEKSADKMVGQALASTFSSLLLGRDFGNLTKGFINYGVEKMNEEYLDFLREGDYDPYKDALQYSVITPDDKKKDISDFVLKMGGSFGPVLSTANLVLKKSFEPKKKEEGAIERQEKEIGTRIPLEIAGNLGFIPFYKDIRKTVMKDMYKGIEQEKEQKRLNAEEVSDRKEESRLQKERALKQVMDRYPNTAVKEAAKDLLNDLNVETEEDKNLLKEERAIEREDKKSLLVDPKTGTTYDNESELKRYNPILWKKNFGPYSEWHKKYKAEKLAKKAMNKEIKKEEDKEYKYFKRSSKTKKNRDGSVKRTYSYKKSLSTDGTSSSTYNYSRTNADGSFSKRTSKTKRN
jgi:hypothetical protein